MIITFELFQKEEFISLHFAAGFMTRYSLEKAFKEKKHADSGAPHPKRLRVNTGKFSSLSAKVR